MIGQKLASILAGKPAPVQMVTQCPPIDTVAVWAVVKKDSVTRFAWYVQYSITSTNGSSYLQYLLCLSYISRKHVAFCHVASDSNNGLETGFVFNPVTVKKHRFFKLFVYWFEQFRSPLSAILVCVTENTCSSTHWACLDLNVEIFCLGLLFHIQ